MQPPPPCRVKMLNQYAKRFGGKISSSSIEVGRSWSTVRCRQWTEEARLLLGRDTSRSASLRTILATSTYFQLVRRYCCLHVFYRLICIVGGTI